MKFLATLFSLMAISSMALATEVQSYVDVQSHAHACKSIMRVKSPKFQGYDEVAYLGPYFKKHQRSMGFLDQEAYVGVGFFHTTFVHPGNSIAVRIRNSEAIGDVKNVVMLRYSPFSEDVFPSELNIYQLIVFCSNSEMAIENKMSEYAKNQHLLVKPTSDLIK